MTHGRAIESIVLRDLLQRALRNIYLHNEGLGKLHIFEHAVCLVHALIDIFFNRISPIYVRLFFIVLELSNFLAFLSFVRIIRLFTNQKRLQES